jgi:hypothetical protein
MACEGTVSINITYKIAYDANGSPNFLKPKDEVLIGWQDLVGLAVIHEGFPAQIKVVGRGAKNGGPDRHRRAVYRRLPGRGDKAHEGQANEDPPGRLIKPTRVLTARQVPVHLRESAARC